MSQIHCNFFPDSAHFKIKGHSALDVLLDLNDHLLVNEYTRGWGGPAGNGWGAEFYSMRSLPLRSLQLAREEDGQGRGNVCVPVQR